MKITLLCSDVTHPINKYIELWAQRQSGLHEVEIVQKKTQLIGGDILFLISCSEIIGASDCNKFSSSLVLHASDLPRGRGWSPHIWDLLEGADFITLSLLEAGDQVDSGSIWIKKKIPIPHHALWSEINDLLFNAEIELIDYAVSNFGRITGVPQDLGIPATYRPKRTPQDSRLDINKSISDQFDLMRLSDPNRFPAYFEYLGHRYTLKLEKCDEQ